MSRSCPIILHEANEVEQRDVPGIADRRPVPRAAQLQERVWFPLAANVGLDAIYGKRVRPTVG